MCEAFHDKMGILSVLSKAFPIIDETQLINCSETVWSSSQTVFPCLFSVKALMDLAWYLCCWWMWDHTVVSMITLWSYCSKLLDQYSINNTSSFFTSFSHLDCSTSRWAVSFVLSCMRKSLCDKAWKTIVFCIFILHLPLLLTIFSHFFNNSCCKFLWNYIHPAAS